MPSRPPRYAESQPHHQSRRGSCPPGTDGSASRTVINVLSGYHAPNSGGGIRLQREDVPVKSSVILLTARVSLRSAGAGLVPTLSVLASCHSRERSGEEQTGRRRQSAIGSATRPRTLAISERLAERGFKSLDLQLFRDREDSC
jgi:hypothetical protein